ncbi:hypothetical protein Taro_002084 [Colocasia esculenta]|uniref:Uncharacterized protein n=1 Tax=Colocasia esculenta TaxID=4460 RepID=A0A843TJP7_COLES|nr:hypothetical protein [Colocasia esculenta]
MPMEGYDVILGADWLCTYGAIVDCRRGKISFSEFPKLTFTGRRHKRHLTLVSAIKAQNMIRKGSMAFLAAIVVEKKAVKISDILCDGPRYTGESDGDDHTYGDGTEGDAQK